MRVADLLEDRGIPFERMPVGLAFSAQRRARYLQIPGRFVAKSVLLHGPTGYLVAILPATHRINTAVLTRHLGGPVRLANNKEVGQLLWGCEAGVVPAFGTMHGLPTILDASIPAEGVMVFEGPTRAEGVRLRCQDFERLERPTRLRFAFQGTSREHQPERL